MKKTLTQKDNNKIKIIETVFYDEFCKSCFDEYKVINFIEKQGDYLLYEGISFENKKDTIKIYHPEKFVEGLDMRNYGADIARLKENFFDDNSVIIPEINWIRTGKLIISYDFVEGELLSGQIEEKYQFILNKIVEVLYNMIFRDGYFCYPIDMFVKNDKLIINPCGEFYQLSIGDRKLIAEQILQKKSPIKLYNNDLYDSINSFFALIEQKYRDVNFIENIMLKLPGFIEKTKNQKKDCVEFEGYLYRVSEDKKIDIFSKKQSFATGLSEKLYGNINVIPKKIKDSHGKSVMLLPWLMIIVCIFLFLYFIFANNQP